jgi:hypothetical protein
LPSEGMDKACNVTENFPSNDTECVPELFPSKGMNGESDGEFMGENFTHSGHWHRVLRHHVAKFIFRNTHTNL